MTTTRPVLTAVAAITKSCAPRGVPVFWTCASNPAEWLAEASEKIDPQLILEELKQRPRSAWARTGYLLETGARVDVAEAIEKRAPEGKGPFYLGLRKSRGRHDRRWDVRDSVLRFRAIHATDSSTATESTRAQD